uniref:Uncharacterized protein n=1 Tax=Stomoxys calcitrans TaxID=35570 RepID=A0A1I8PWA1_STOCA
MLKKIKKIVSISSSSSTSITVTTTTTHKPELCQDENRRLLDRLMHYKSKDADKLNEENESFISSSIHGGGAGGESYDDSDRDTLSGDHNIETGCDAEMYGSPNDQFHVSGLGYMNSANPTNIYMKFEAHETESHAVRWAPIERVIATGGADRKVKLWDVGKGSSEPRAVLGGSSAGINSVDFDSTGTYIIGTSNDYGARVWTVADNRLRKIKMLITCDEGGQEVQ